MIASRSLNFIFLKTRKTGGTSVEIVLSSWCGADDVCAKIHGPDEAIRTAFGGKARNFLGADGNKLFFNHMTAQDVRRALPDLWAGAHRFTVERHPYEKVVSRAWWNVAKRRGDPERDIAAAIEEAIDTGSYLNHPIYTFGNRVAVHEVIAYERMWERIGELAAGWGRSMPQELPRAKAAHRLDRRDATETLTRGQRERIYDAARFEFDLMGFAR